jgi:hypothetical protein
VTKWQTSPQLEYPPHLVRVKKLFFFDISEKLQKIFFFHARANNSHVIPSRAQRGCSKQDGAITVGVGGHCRVDDFRMHPRTSKCESYHVTPSKGPLAPLGAAYRALHFLLMGA